MSDLIAALVASQGELSTVITQYLLKNKEDIDDPIDSSANTHLHGLAEAAIASEELCTAICRVR